MDGATATEDDTGATEVVTGATEVVTATGVVEVDVTGAGAGVVLEW